MANLSRAMTPERKKQCKKTYFDIFAIPMGFAHVATLYRPGLDTQRSETETRICGYETEKRSRLRKTCLERGRVVKAPEL